MRDEQKKLLRQQKRQCVPANVAPNNSFGYLCGTVAGRKDSIYVRLVGTVLGKGSFGQVLLAQDVQCENELVAVKTINLTPVVKSNAKAIERIRTEIDALHAVKGTANGALQLRYVIENDRFIYIVTNYISGLTLEQTLIRSGRMSEARAACLLRQLCETVKSVHSQKWIHHDISLSNIIVEQRQLADDDNNNNNFNNNSFGSNSTVQLRTHLVDFGLAQYSHSDAALLDSYGATPFFSAPELLNRKPHRGSPVDCFALGVVLFAMVNNRLPYAANDIAELRRLATTPAPLIFDDDVSTACRSVVLGLLQPEPSLRMTIDDILSSAWMMQHCPSTNTAATTSSASSSSSALAAPSQPTAAPAAAASATVGAASSSMSSAADVLIDLSDNSHNVVNNDNVNNNSMME